MKVWLFYPKIQYLVAGADYAYIMITFGRFLAFMRLWVECIVVRPSSIITITTITTTTTIITITIISR